MRILFLASSEKPRQRNSLDGFQLPVAGHWHSIQDEELVLVIAGDDAAGFVAGLPRG